VGVTAAEGPQNEKRKKSRGTENRTERVTDVSTFFQKKGIRKGGELVSTHIRTEGEGRFRHQVQPRGRRTGKK